MLFTCAFVNVLALHLLFPVVKKELSEYWDDRREGRLVQKDDQHS